MNFFSIQFAFPAFLYFLLLVPLFIIIFVTNNQRRKKIWRVWQQRGVRQSRFFSLIKQYALLASYISLVIALAHPQKLKPFSMDEEESNVTIVRREEKQKKKRVAHNVIFLVDTSASMEVADTRLGRSRLESALEIMEAILQQLQGEHVAVYAFTSELATIVPLTTDYLYAQTRVRSIQLNEGDVAGTNFMQALEGIAERHLRSLQFNTTLVILSDGGDTHLEQLEGNERAEGIKLIVGRLGVHQPYLRVFTIGLGTAQGSPIPNLTFEGEPIISQLDEELLQEIAEWGNGKYIFANQTSSWQLAQEIQAVITSDRRYIEEEQGEITQHLKMQEWEDLTLYPIYFAVCCLLLFLGYPDSRTRFKLLFIAGCLHLNSLAAIDVTEGIRFMEVEDYSSAQEFFQKMLEKELTPEEHHLILYNLGDALLHQEEFSRALDTFERIQLTEQDSPILKDSLFYNQSFCYLNLAKKEEQLEQGLIHLQQAVEFFWKSEAQAQRVYELEEEERKDQLLPMHQVMKEQLKWQLNQMHHSFLKKKIMEGELSEGLQLFYVQLKAMISQLEKKENLLKIKVDLKNLNPLWLFLIERIEKEDDSEEKKILEEAYHDFNRAYERVTYLKDRLKIKSDIKRTLMSLERLEAEQIEKKWRKNPNQALKEGVDHILSLFKEKKIQQIHNKTQLLKERVDKHKKNMEQGLVGKFQKGMEWEQLTYNQFLKQEKEQVEFYSALSEQAMKHLTRNPITSQNALQYAIEDEAVALTLSKFAKYVTSTSSRRKILYKAQALPVEEIVHVPQEHPRIQEIDKGTDQAKTALEELLETHPNLEVTIEFQKATLNYWQENQNPPPPPKSEGAPPSPSQEENERLLKKLQQEDQPRSPKKIIKKGLRPW